MGLTTGPADHFFVFASIKTETWIDFHSELDVLLCFSVQQADNIAVGALLLHLNFSFDVNPWMRSFEVFLKTYQENPWSCDLLMNIPWTG